MSYRLVRIDSAETPEAFWLSGHGINVVGRGNPLVHIDLATDRFVTSFHADLWRDKGRWWVLDKGSRWGTKVGGEEIKGKKEPTPLYPWVPLQMGINQFMLVSASWHRFQAGGLIFDLDLSPTVNYALFHVGVPLIRRFVVRNWQAQETAPARLHLALPGYGEAKVLSIPAVPPGAHQVLEPPTFQVDPETLLSPTATIKQLLTIRLNEETLKHDVFCWVLPHNTWSRVPLFRHQYSLAAFVLRNHPLVAQLAAEATYLLPHNHTSAQALEAIYAHLLKVWHIAYRKEPPFETSQGQQVRFPHQVLQNVEDKRGKGTCLDLALLMAACLEQLKHKPLIALLDLKTISHALVGCWKEPFDRLAPIYREPGSWMEEVLWIDPNGCTREPWYRQDFPSCCREADRQRAAYPLSYALDIAAVREVEEVTPLPFGGEPNWSKGVQEARRKVQEGATSYQVQKSAVVLLYGLLKVVDGFTRQCFDKEGYPVEEMLGRIEDLLEGRSGSGDPGESTRHYLEAFEQAPLLAKREDVPLIMERHLLCALVRTHSGELKKVLGKLQVDLLSHCLNDSGGKETIVF